MTAITDLDRVLGEWLDDGPTRAPDRPLAVALAHARSHPRRPDPLRFLRPDAMAGRPAAFGARPVLVLAVLGLLLAAVVVVGVGSDRREVVSPPVSASAEPTLSTPPSPSRLSLGVVALFDDLATGATVTIDDASGLVVGAEGARPADRGPDPTASIPDSGVLVQNEDPTTLRVTWVGGGCPTAYRMSVDATARQLTISGPTCGGDSIGVGRVLLLRFADPVDASLVSGTLGR
jgi:hypothetical protein